MLFVVLFLHHIYSFVDGIPSSSLYICYLFICCILFPIFYIHCPHLPHCPIIVLYCALSVGRSDPSVVVGGQWSWVFWGGGDLLLLFIHLCLIAHSLLFHSFIYLEVMGGTNDLEWYRSGTACVPIHLCCVVIYWHSFSCPIYSLSPHSSVVCCVPSLFLVLTSHIPLHLIYYSPKIPLLYISCWWGWMVENGPLPPFICCLFGGVVVYCCWWVFILLLCHHCCVVDILTHLFDPSLRYIPTGESVVPLLFCIVVVLHCAPVVTFIYIGRHLSRWWR